MPSLQFSTRTLLLVMAVLCGTAAGLFYASDVPAIREEIGLLIGQPMPAKAGQSRAPWVAFILFTYTAPLLLAGLLSVVSKIGRWSEQRRERTGAIDSNDEASDRHPLD
jgi:hypothetical protein